MTDDMDEMKKKICELVSNSQDVDLLQFLLSLLILES